MEQANLKAMVMCAGMGSRLEPLTLQVPKPLVTVANRPIMDILFENLVNIGIKDVICNTYYLADQIINRYKSNNIGLNFNYIKEETLSGTAGGLKKCQFFFNEGEDFVVLSADGLTNADILKGIEIHKKSGAIATIGIKRVKHEEVSHFGVVVTDKNGFIVEFQEKPPVEEAKSSFGFDEAAKCCCVLANCGGVCLYSVFLTSDLEKWLEAMLLSNRKEPDVH